MTTLAPLPETMSPSTLAQEAMDIAAPGLSLVAAEFEDAPAEVGGKYSDILSSAINDIGSVAFIATLSGSDVPGAIFLKSSSGTRAIARIGEDAPGGGKYRSFKELDLINMRSGDTVLDMILLNAELEGGSAEGGLFLWSDEGVQTIALTGGRSPRGRTYKSFSQITIHGGIGDGFRLTFVALMEEGSKSIIFKQSFGDTTPVETLSTGDRLGKNVVDDFVISKGALSLSCIADMHAAKNQKKHIRELIVVDSGFIISNGSLKEGARFKKIGKLVRIIAPPAVNFQDGIVAVEFKDGTSGLALRDVFGGANIFARTGDPAPGLPGETIERFNAPVANSLPPHLPGFSDNYGVISEVLLSGGQRALWVGVFTTTFPLDGQARLFLVGGNSSGDNQGLTLESFSPVKLNNHGSLLLRGAFNVEGELREGLFTIGGLFD